ncbi:MAG: NAD(P)H-hydrate dehydratase [FCB group bacterium]|nr:NAD(P)H-hydrate dehydratase [FCB group bacterium]
MIPILSESEARRLDERTIKSGRLSGADLMENAGLQSARYFADTVQDVFSKTVLIVAGKGNNGGDGIVMHHYLLQFGINSTMLLLSESEQERKVVKSHEIPEDTVIIYNETVEFRTFDWVVDAVFGIGLKRDIEGMYEILIHKINSAANVISLDIPSGIYTDTGTIGNCAVRAKLTLTMGYPKPGLFLNDGLSYAGEVVTLDIGFDDLDKDEVIRDLITIGDIRSRLKPHPVQAHKYSRGKIITLAGSKGMTGAAVLACRSAYRSGCGIIRSIVPGSLNSAFESASTETITIPVEDNHAGYLSDDAQDEIIRELGWGDVLICGPGLSTVPESAALTGAILRSWQKPLVLDASGFEPLINDSIAISELPQKSILSPHLHEFCRLFDKKKETVMADPLGALESVSALLQGRVLILKGAPTLILTASGLIHFMTQGNPILATAGSGDVLSGLLGGLLAQGYSIDDTAMIATWLHAEAGNLFIRDRGPKGLVASDLITYIPEAYAALTSAP